MKKVHRTHPLLFPIIISLSTMRYYNRTDYYLNVLILNSPVFFMLILQSQLQLLIPLSFFFFSTRCNWGGKWLTLLSALSVWLFVNVQHVWSCSGEFQFEFFRDSCEIPYLVSPSYEHAACFCWQSNLSLKCALTEPFIACPFLTLFILLRNIKLVLKWLFVRCQQRIFSCPIIYLIIIRKRPHIQV